jgi:hypothetical protein
MTLVSSYVFGPMEIMMWDISRLLINLLLIFVLSIYYVNKLKIFFFFFLAKII